MNTEKTQKTSTQNVQPQKRPSPGIFDFLAGERKNFVADLNPYLPQDLIGGAIPHVAGMEDEAVWNAACQACGTEKVHYTYAIDDGKVWYLACPSLSFASNPDSWCPLAAALPGNSEYWDRETVYLYEQEGLASALRWDPETDRMQVFLGASRTILPRVQSMDANFVTINPDIADIVTWKHKQLRTEKMSRAVVKTLIFSGLGLNLIALAILLYSLTSIGFSKSDLEQTRQETKEAANALMENAANIMQSDTIRHMVRIQNLLDSLAETNGYLVRYEVSGNRTEWNAIVPQGLANTAIKNTTLRDTSDGRIRTYSAKVTNAEKGDTVRIEGIK